MACGTMSELLFYRGWSAGPWLGKYFTGGGPGDLARQFLLHGLVLWPSLTFYGTGQYHGHLIQTFSG